MGKALLGTDGEEVEGTGHSVAITAVIVQEVRDGRITAERHYMELLEFFAQVGLLGRPGG